MTSVHVNPAHSTESSQIIHIYNYCQSKMIVFAIFAIGLVWQCNAIPSHSEKVKAEQAYETLHKCVKIDAAITYDDVVYLFNDNEYITLDAAGDETSLKNIKMWGLLTSDVDSGIVWAGNDNTYFFKGSDYYRYMKAFVGSITVGPFSSSKWTPFFELGIGAAGNHKGTSYFFQKCHVAKYTSEKIAIKITPSKELNLPCKVDAAFSRGDTLYVIKNDKVWTWKGRESKATGPAPLDSVVKMTSWKACK